MMTFQQKGQLWHNNLQKHSTSIPRGKRSLWPSWRLKRSHFNAPTINCGRAACIFDFLWWRNVLFSWCLILYVYHVCISTIHVIDAVWSVYLNFLHMVRAHIHASDPAQLCDSGNVPALWRHQLPVRLVPHPAGQSVSQPHLYVFTVNAIFLASIC